MSENPTASGVIQSDQTLVQILETLYDLERAGVTEVSDRLNISKGTVHKHLKTLEREDYVEKTDQAYQLGMRFFQFGGQVRNRNRLCFMAKDRVEAVAAETAEMTKFAVEHDGLGIWIYFHNDHYEMRRDMHVGGNFKLHQNATGKAMLAELPDERVREILDQYGMEAKTGKTVTDREALFAELEEVSEAGLAQSAGEFRAGGISIAAPVRDPDSGTLGAIALAGPSTKASPDEMVEEHGEVLVDTARRLELQLRYI